LQGGFASKPPFDAQRSIFSAINLLEKLMEMVGEIIPIRWMTAGANSLNIIRYEKI